MPFSKVGSAYTHIEEDDIVVRATAADLLGDLSARRKLNACGRYLAREDN